MGTRVPHAQVAAFSCRKKTYMRGIAISRIPRPLTTG